MNQCAMWKYCIAHKQSRVVWWPVSALSCRTLSEHSRTPTWSGHSRVVSGRRSAESGRRRAERTLFGRSTETSSDAVRPLTALATEGHSPLYCDRSPLYFRCSPLYCGRFHFTQGNILSLLYCGRFRFTAVALHTIPLSALLRPLNIGVWTGSTAECTYGW